MAAELKSCSKQGGINHKYISIHGNGLFLKWILAKKEVSYLQQELFSNEMARWQVSNPEDIIVERVHFSPA